MMNFRRKNFEKELKKGGRNVYCMKNKLYTADLREEYYYEEINEDGFHINISIKEHKRLLKLSNDDFLYFPKGCAYINPTEVGIDEGGNPEYEYTEDIVHIIPVSAIAGSWYSDKKNSALVHYIYKG